MEYSEGSKAVDRRAFGLLQKCHSTLKPYKNVVLQRLNRYALSCRAPWLAGPDTWANWAVAQGPDRKGA